MQLYSKKCFNNLHIISVKFIKILTEKLTRIHRQTLTVKILIHGNFLLIRNKQYGKSKKSSPLRIILYEKNYLYGVSVSHYQVFSP